MDITAQILEINGQIRPKLENYIGAIGIYIFFDGEICAYVGKADCLQRRILFHIKRKKYYTSVLLRPLSNELNGLTYEGTKAIHRFYESRFIRQLAPVENIRRPVFDERSLWRMPIDAQRRIVELMPNILD